MVTGKMIESRLQAWGEVMLVVEEFDEPLELHAHDTELTEEGFILELTDGEIQVEYDRVVAVYKHTQSLDDYGLH